MCQNFDTPLIIPTPTQKPRAVPWAVSCCPFGAPILKDFGIDFEKFLAKRPFLFGQTQGCSHRPERPSATSPGQRPGLYDARGCPPCKGKSFCTFSAKIPTPTQKPRAMPWAVSCCPFGASLGARCCSGRHRGVHIGLKGHRPERPSATSPGQRPGLYDARGSPPCKGKSFCTFSAKNPTATQKPRAVPWAVSCCPFGASILKDFGIDF